MTDFAPLIANPKSFLAWLFQFGKSASIISPKSLKEDYKKMLTEVISNFDE